MEERLSPLEERFERWRRSIGLFLGPAVAAALWLARMPALGRPAHTLAGVLGWIVVWWVTEPIPLPMTALLGSVLCVLTGVAGAKAVLAAFADPLIFLFLGSFILAEAMAVHGLDKRFAYRIMSIRWVGDRPGRILLAYGAICAFLSMWISNTAATAMMFPIGLGMVSALAGAPHRSGGDAPPARQSRFAAGMMLMAAYAASAGGIGTPVGTPPNLIGLAMIERFANLRITFFQWMLFAVPLLAVMLLLLFVLLYGLHRPERGAVGGGSAFMRGEAARLGSWTRGQKNTVAAFALAVLLWILPGLAGLLLGSQSAPARFLSARFPEAVAALLAAFLLFLLPVDWRSRTFTLSWRQATRIDWGTLLLFGGGIALGELMFKTGLAEAVGRGLLQLSGARSVWGVTLAAVYIAIVVSEATSNTASANMVVPVIISLALAAGLNPVPPAIGATLGASWGFMLPVSTPPNAIVYGSGLVPITRMVRAGILFDLLGGLVIWLGLRLLLPLAGLA